MTNREKLLLLRVQLYTAAQTLKGDELDELRELLDEVKAVADAQPSAACNRCGVCGAELRHVDGGGRRCPVC